MDLQLDYAAIGARIRKLRRQRLMTGERLAELADTSKANISHIETNNTKLSLAMLVRIANALQVTPNELLADNLSPQKAQFEQQLADIVENCSAAQLSLIVELARTVSKWHE
jgi:hypothetical protein